MMMGRWEWMVGAYLISTLGCGMPIKHTLRYSYLRRSIFIIFLRPVFSELGANLIEKRRKQLQ